MNIYETQRLLDEYLLFHYGRPQEVLPWSFGPWEALGFASRTVHELLDKTLLRKKTRALDLGCAVGRSTFELASVCGSVTGIDFSQSFITAAKTLQSTGVLAYQRIDEGSAATALVAEAPHVASRHRASFETGDAMNLRGDLGGFDVVHAANLLCRLSEPQRLLERLPSLVRAGGQLLLATPCTWLEEFTPPCNWPRGSTREWLLEKLGPHFTLDLQADLPFLIREHSRKFQWSVALGTRWIRRKGASL